MSRLRPTNPVRSVPSGLRSMLFGVAALCLLLPGQALAYTDIRVTPADPLTGAGTDHEVRFTTEASFNNGSRIEISYPSAFDLSGISLGTTSGLGGGFLTLTLSGQTVILTRTGFNSNPGPKSVVLNGVVNSSLAGSYSVTLQSYTSADNLVEGPMDSASFEILDPLPDHLSLQPLQPSVEAGSYLRLRLEALDATETPRPPGSDQALNLLSTSASGEFRASPGSAVIESAVLLADSSGLDLWYRDVSITASPVDLTVLDVSGTAPSLGFVQSTITVLAGEADAAQSSVLASSPVIADGLAYSTVDLILRDALGNPVSGVDSSLVALSIPTADFAVEKLQALSGPGGEFRARLRTLVAGSHPVTAVVDGVALTQQPSVQFQLRPVDAAQSSLGAGPDALANGIDAVDLLLTLRDDMGRAVAGLDSAQVVFTVLDGPGLLTELNAASDAAGAFRAELRSTLAGSRRIAARVGGVDVADTVTVAFLTGAVDPARSSVVLDAPAVADGSDFITATIVLRDAFDNPVSAVDSSLISIAISDALVSKLDAASGADGSFQAELRSSVAGTRPVNVVAGGVPLSAAALAQFIAGALDSTRSQLSGAPNSQIADGVQAILLELTLRDGFDNPVSGVDSSRVHFDAPPSWQLIKLDVASDANGHFRAELRSTLAGNAAVIARVDASAMGDPLALQFVAGSLDHFTLLLPDGAAVLAGQPARLRVEARDTQDNRIFDYLQTVRLSSNSSGPGSNLSWSGGGGGSLISQSPGVADYAFAAADSGLAEFLATNTLSEILDLMVTEGPIQGAVSLQVDPAAAAQLTLLSGDGQSATVAQTVPSPLRVRVSDAFDNPVPGTVVDFMTADGGRIDTDPVSPGEQGSIASDFLGVASCSVWELGTLAGPQQVNASTAFGGNVIFLADARAGPVATLRLEPEGAQTLEVGSAATLAARASDLFDNPVPGLEVTFFVSDALDGVLSGLGETDSLGISQQRGSTAIDGRVRVRYTAPVTAGLSDVIDATAAGFPATAVNDLVLTTVEGSAVALRLELPVPALRAGDEGRFPVRLLDAFGNDAPGASATVQLRAELATGLEFSTTSGGPFTNALDLPVFGAREIFYRGGPAGLHDFTAEDTAALLAGDAGQLEILSSTIVASFTLNYPTSSFAGVDFSFVTEAYDAWGNLAVDAVESFDLDVVSAADTTVTLPVPLAVDSGVLIGGRFVTAIQRIDLAGDVALRLSNRGIGSVGAPLRIDPAGEYELVSVSADSLNGIPAGDLVDFQVEVRDPFGNPVPGASLNQLLLEGGSLEQAPSTSDVAGRALFRLRTATTVGTARLRVGILDGTPVARESALLVVQTVAGPVASLSVELADSVMVAGTDLGLTVRAFDAGGNPALAASDALDLSVIGSGGVITPPSGSLVNGVFSASVRDTLVGSLRLQAALSSAPGVSAQSELLRIAPAAAHRILAQGVTIFDAPAGGRSILRSVVQDRFGNRVPGTLVRLALLDSPPGAALEDPDAPIDDGLATTDPDGVLDFDLLLSSTTGVHRVRASILDANPSAEESVEWAVTGISGAADHVVLSLPSDTLIAGTPSLLTIRVEDGADNLVPFEGELVLAFTPSGPVTLPDPVVVSGGSATVDLTAFSAGDLDIQASLVTQPGVGGTLSELLVQANLAAGTIPVPIVDPNPNTANGLAVTRLQAGPVVDAWGNPVAEGTSVDLSSDGGAWISEDMDPSKPGLQRLSDASGVLEARLVAPTSASLVTVDIAAASASGQANLQFLSPAQLALDGVAAPSAAVPGQLLDFQVPVRNLGEVDAQLSASLSTIDVDDGQGVSFQAALAGDITIPAGGSTMLSFVSTLLPANFAPGSHRPSLSLAGQDSYAQPVSAFLVLPQGALQIGALLVRSVTHPLQAVVGDTLELRVEVENVGGGPVDVVELALSSSPISDFQFLDRDLLSTLSAGASQSFASRWIVGPATNAGNYRFIARVTGRVGGAEFSAPADSSTMPLTVGNSSQLELVSGGITPDRIHQTAPLQLRVAVRNAGGTTVDLDPARTRVSMGGGLWSATLAAPIALPPSGQGSLVFEIVDVPAALPPGDQDLQLHLEGDESGRPVSVDLTATAAILIETPAVLALGVAPLDPAAALRGASIPFLVQLENTGQATVTLDPLSTRLLLGEPAGERISTLLDASSVRDLVPGSSAVFFQNLTLPRDLQLADPVGHVELRGLQNGQPYAMDLALPTSALSLQDPAGLRILATEAQHPRAPASDVNAGQSIPVRVVVGNAGGDAIDSLRVSLGGSSQPPSTTPTLLRPRLAAGATDTLLFDVDLTTALGPEVLRARIESAVSALTGEAIVPESPLDDEASLNVQRPVALAFVAEWVDTLDPLATQVSPGQVFEMRVAIERVPPLDSQGSWIGVDVQLGGLGGFVLEPGSDNPVTLQQGAPEAILRLRAPPAAELANIAVSLSRRDLDANDPSADPLQTADSFDLSAEVVGGTAFDLCELRIGSPLGATDGILSGGQSFVIEGELDGPTNLQERALELLLPAQLALVGGSARQDLAPGTTTVTWQLQCASQPVESLELRVVAHARDVQSSEVIADTCSTLQLQIVAAAEARADLSILAPTSARDRGELAPGGIVEFQGAFAILGDAVPLGPAQLRIELPPGFTLLDGVGAVQTLSDPTSSVSWRAQGPSQLDLGVQTIRLHTETPASDENSGAPVIGAGEIDAVALSILTDPLRLQLSDLDPGSNLIASDRIYHRAQLDIYNGHGEASRLVSFELRIVDDSGRDHADPAAFLQALELRRTDGSGSWTLPASANPIRFTLDDAVAADGSAEFSIGVQAREEASGVSFAFQVEASGAELVDPNDFPLGYTLLDADGVGRSPIVVGASVTASSDPQLGTHSYPNPFVPSREVATLTYQLAQDSNVDIQIFDLLGERVMEWSFPLGAPEARAGLHDGDVTWDGRNGRGESVRNGVYLCRFQAEGREIFFRIAVTR